MEARKRCTVDNKNPFMISNVSRGEFLKRFIAAAALGAPLLTSTKGGAATADEVTDPLIQDPGVSTMYALGEAGAGHRLLEPLVGDWNATMRIFAGPGQVVTSLGMKSRKRAVLEGRQIMEEIYEGTIAGVPHRKITMLGYNAVNQRYEFVTADNLDTQQMVYRGSRDPASGAIVMTSSYTQAAFADIVPGDGMSRSSGKPASHRSIVGLEMTVRDVLAIHSTDRHTLQMYFTPSAGNEALGVEYEYVRG